MYKIFSKSIFNIFILRFNENKKYIQGMFSANNSKINKAYISFIEYQSTKSNTLKDNEMVNLENSDDNSLVNKVKLTSE